MTSGSLSDCAASQSQLADRSVKDLDQDFRPAVLPLQRQKGVYKLSFFLNKYKNMTKTMKTTYGNTETIACKLCKRTMQFRNTKIHYQKKHQKFIKQHGLSRDLALHVTRPNYNELSDITKIEKVYDVAESSIEMVNGETTPRGPFVMARVKLDSTHLEKNETQAFPFELRHLYDSDLFKKWVKLASTRTSKLHTIESKDRALNFYQYALALEGAEHLPLEKNDEGTQVCPICVCEVDEDDDVAKFFCQKNNGESIETCADGMVHGMHGHCLDEELKHGMKPFECFKCRQEGFYL